MTREQAFLSYKTHAWFNKVYSKLSQAELLECLAFIKEHDSLNKGDFEHKVNRMFLNTADKPKNWSRMLELLTCANSSLE